jgi:hypothetical protein
MAQHVTPKVSTTEKFATTELATLAAKSKPTKQMNVLEAGCTQNVLRK